MKLTARHYAAGGAAVIMATTIVAGFEGYRSYVYPDPATRGAPWTYCYGSTANPQFGHTYTKEECLAELQGTIQSTDNAVRVCVRSPMPVKVEASFVSLAYNIGTGAFCGSTLVKKANLGDLKGACNEMPKWNRAAGKPMRGLTVRRGEEQALCLEGVAEGLPK